MPVKFIVKLGGAAITVKEKLETLNGPILHKTALQLAEAIQRSESDSDSSSSHRSRCVVVHGAGSFGHFQAKEYGVLNGRADSERVMRGIVATRLSVTMLNLTVVRELSEAGVPAVGLSPFSMGWDTTEGSPSQSARDTIEGALKHGLIPVLHGDTILDHPVGRCSILSGDTIISQLARSLKPKIAIFLTNVDGVFDKPPSQPDSTLIKRIEVDESGNWTIVEPHIDSVQTDAMGHDTTGGMAAKIGEAVAVAVLGIPVLIVKAGSEWAAAAMAGNHPGVDRGNETENKPWIGTFIYPKLQMQ